MRFRLLVVGLAGATMLFGFLQLPNVSVDTTPEFSPPYVEIQTEALGLSAEEVEQLITVPLEADLLNGVPWLDSITSESVPSLSSIVLTFEPGTDVLRARQVVAERLTQAHALPNVSKPPAMVQPLSSTSRVMMIGLKSDQLSLIDMSVLARWTMRPRLLGVPGVAEVAIFGERERELQVLVDPERLAEHEVALEDVVKTAGNALWVSPLSFLEASTPGTGGFIDTPNQRLGVQHILPITSAEELARVTLEPDESRTGDLAGLRLGDVADVVEDHQPLIGDALVDSEPGLILVVEKFPEADTLTVTRGVDEALDALGPGLAGIEIDAQIFRSASFIEAAIGNVGLALIVGLVLVAIALGVLLYDWRGLVIALTSIALSLATAGLVVYLFGATINAMVVAGFALAIGVLIDDVVVATEGTATRLRHRHRGENRKSKVSLIIEATLEQRTSLLYATIIILAIVVPAMVVPGATGVFLAPLMAAYAAAVLVSMFVALTVTVALAILLAPRRSERRDSMLVIGLQSRYQTALRWLANRPRSVVLTAGAVTIGVVVLFGVGMIPQLGNPLTPAFRERSVLLSLEAPPGTSRIEMNRIMAEAGRDMKAIPGILNVGAHVGRAVMSDQVVGINSGQMWMTLDPDADYEATLGAIANVADDYPGLSRDILTYPDQQIDRALGESDDELVVRVYGQDLDVLRQEAEDVRRAISGIDGIDSATVEQHIEEPTLKVEIDLAASRRHGVKPGDIRRAATTLLSGIGVGALFEEQKVFNVVVWGEPEIRESVTNVRELLLEAPDGGHVTLEQVADVSVEPAPSVITREGVFRRIDVSANLDGRDLGAVARDVEAGIRQLDFPLEYRAEVLDASALRQDEELRLLGV
ncbi:MAG: efflux RND transporter permease subunit, partial [Chloroflexota bacterium]|nr:efflux RND transporter permease subunit [Chloroflexota bacterium]